MVNVQEGVRWRGPWPAGRIEANRRLYDYELVYFQNGKGRVITGENTFYFKPGSLIIIPPGIVHCTIAETEVERWCIHFNWYGDCAAYQAMRYPYIYLSRSREYQSELAASPLADGKYGFPLFRHLSAGDAKTMAELLQRYFMAIPDGLDKRLEQHGDFLHILSLALKDSSGRNQTLPGKINVRFFKAKSTIDSHFREPDLQIRKIASELEITPNHLIKLFRMNIGMSALDYLQELRMEEAVKLLRETNLTIREIAVECGIEDPNYFARYFRRRFGATPTVYRRLCQTNDTLAKVKVASPMAHNIR